MIIEGKAEKDPLFKSIYKLIPVEVDKTVDAIIDRKITLEDLDMLEEYSDILNEIAEVDDDCLDAFLDANSEFNRIMCDPTALEVKILLNDMDDLCSNLEDQVSSVSEVVAYRDTDALVERARELVYMAIQLSVLAKRSAVKATGGANVTSPGVSEFMTLLGESVIKHASFDIDENTIDEFVDREGYYDTSQLQQYIIEFTLVPNRSKKGVKVSPLNSAPHLNNKPEYIALDAENKSLSKIKKCEVYVKFKHKENKENVFTIRLGSFYRNGKTNAGNLNFISAVNYEKTKKENKMALDFKHRVTDPTLLYAVQKLYVRRETLAELSPKWEKSVFSLRHSNLNDSTTQHLGYWRVSKVDNPTSLIVLIPTNKTARDLMDIMSKVFPTINFRQVRRDAYVRSEVKDLKIPKTGSGYINSKKSLSMLEFKPDHRTCNLGIAYTDAVLAEERSRSSTIIASHLFSDGGLLICDRADATMEDISKAADESIVYVSRLHGVGNRIPSASTDSLYSYYGTDMFTRTPFLLKKLPTRNKGTFLLIPTLTDLTDTFPSPVEYRSKGEIKFETYDGEFTLPQGTRYTLSNGRFKGRVPYDVAMIIEVDSLNDIQQGDMLSQIFLESSKGYSVTLEKLADVIHFDSAFLINNTLILTKTGNSDEVKHWALLQETYHEYLDVLKYKSPVTLKLEVEGALNTSYHLGTLNTRKGGYGGNAYGYDDDDDLYEPIVVRAPLRTSPIIEV